ncbi:MAG: metallophosphoesterase [archaeon]
MLISENIEIHDLALFLKKEKVLIISDLHLGYEELWQKKGILVPNFQYEDIKKRLRPILETTKPNQVIINGDLKHEFGKISQQEWNEVKGILTFLKSYCNKIKLVKGNHDNILGPIARHKEVELVDYIQLGKVYITHGHRLPDARRLMPDAQIVLIGHEHPAIGISDGQRTEVYKCFLKGKWKNKTLIVQPSFCLVTEGTDVLQEGVLSPFLKGQNLKEFEVWVVADVVRAFGEIGNLIKR